ncbi:hypothetical protein NMG60_11032173 [Bertholletia excelsa]
MASRSGYMNRLVFEKKAYSSNPDIRLNNFPGGTNTFELVVKFCYGWKIELTPSNTAPLYCAANFLEMGEDLEQGNLIAKTKCRDLHSLKHCLEAIACNACINPEEGGFLVRVRKTKFENTDETWWFQDVSCLRIDHFVEVIASIKRKGLQRATVESLIRILPIEEGSVSFNYQIHLLKIGIVLKIQPELLDKLEKRTVFKLEIFDAGDLVKNCGLSDAAYDMGIVARVIEAYVLHVSSNTLSRFAIMGRLTDEYMTLAARDANLSAESFQLLVESLPRNARHCDDNLYGGIDMYLKAHPSLTEGERSSICGILDRWIKLQRTKSQAILRTDKGLGKEIKIMKQHVNAIKLQLGQVQLQRKELQGQVARQKLPFVRC